MLFAEIVTANNTYRIATRGHAGQYWWSPSIIRVPRLSLGHADAGGYVKPAFGDLTITPDLLEASDWPPPATCDITLWWGLDEASRFQVFRGIARHERTTRAGITYSLFEPAYAQTVLDTGADETGAAVDVPMAFGAASHLSAQRTGTDTEFRYYTSGATGTVGTDWHVYDDGVNIDSNVTDNGDGTFSLSSAPVGEVTISLVTPNKGDLASLFSWGATTLGLSLDITAAATPSPAIAFKVTTQVNVIDLLDRLAGFHNHVFYIDAGTLYLVDREQDNGSQVLTEWDYFSAPTSMPNPIKELRAEWTVREPVTDRTGSHLKDVTQTAAAAGPDPLGEVISVTPYQEDPAQVETALGLLVTSWQRPYGEIRMPLLAQPVPGRHIEWTDTGQGRQISGWLRVRRITYDFARGFVTVAGDGGVA